MRRGLHEFDYTWLHLKLKGAATPPKHTTCGLGKQFDSHRPPQQNKRLHATATFSLSSLQGRIRAGENYLLRTVNTGHFARVTTLCAVAIGKCVEAPGTPRSGCAPRTIRSTSRKFARSRMRSAALPRSTKYSGLHQASASSGTSFRSSCFEESRTSDQDRSSPGFGSGTTCSMVRRA